MSAATMRKTFGHYSIRWKIKNFILATCQDSFTARSPSFKMSAPDVTDWRMELEMTSGDDDSVLLHLERLDRGPEAVWANWRVEVTDGESVARGPVYCCEYLFGRNRRHTVDLQSLENIIGLLSLNNLDVLKVTCFIIVKQETDARTSREIAGDGFSFLSGDLRRMLSRGKCYDLAINIGGKIIRAHKSVLFERNAVWRRLILGAVNARVVNLGYLDAEATESLIYYFYTGNVRYLLDNPSIELVRCIKFFEAEELYPIFGSKDINMVTKVTSRCVKFKWTLPDFAKRRDLCLRSKVLRKRGLDSTWRLHVYPFGMEHCPRTLAICAETVASPGFRIVRIEFALLNGSGRVTDRARVRGLSASGEMIGVENISPRPDVLRHSLKRGALQIVFRVWSSECDQIYRITSQERETDPEIRTLPHYAALSEAMKSMMVNSPYKDVVLKAGCVEILAHRCILAARSKAFSGLIDKLTCLIKVDIEAGILKIVINYIYYGIISNRDVLSQLYEIADKFCIPSLKEDCKARLQFTP